VGNCAGRPCEREAVAAQSGGHRGDVGGLGGGDGGGGLDGGGDPVVVDVHATFASAGSFEPSAKVASA
jgi:hypothetical protein